MSGATGGDLRSLENGWPIRRSERHWGGGTTFGTSIATAIATWCFIIGGFVSYYLTAKAGTFSIIAGSLVGMLFIVLALLPVCAKYGIDSAVSTRPQLGVRGSYVSVIMIFGATLGWNVILFIFLGRATTSIVEGFGLTAPGWLTGASGVAGAVLTVLFLRKGPQSLKDFGPPIAVLTLILGAIVMFMLVHQLGLGTLLHSRASNPSESPAVNWTSSLEVLIASNLSWWAYTGGIVRNSPSARRALWPLIVGLGLGVGVGSLAGFYAGLVLPETGGDPTQFLIEVGGRAVGIILLVFVVVADLGTAMVGVYASAIGLRQLPKMNKLPWNATTVMAIVPAVVVVGFFHQTMYSHLSTFLAFLGVCFGPMCGIQIADWYLLRRQRLDVHALYNFRRSGPYWYIGGFNPVAFVAFAAGVAVYLYLLNPVDYSSRAPFQFTTASIPAVLVAGGLYLLGTVTTIRPNGLGGYLLRGTTALSKKENA